MQPTGTPTSKPIILYVDDEEPNRQVFALSFDDDFEILVANGVDAALEVLSKHPVQVIVTDQRMPGRSGMDLLGIVKKDYPRVVRMVVTAYTDLDPILRAVNEGLVARYFMKPWDHQEIFEALRWGSEVFRSAEESDVLGARILKTERLATLGTLAASLLHDLRQPLSYMRYNIDRLQQLMPATSGMEKLLAGETETLTLEEQKSVQALSAEYKEIVQDIGAGTLLISDLLKSLERISKPLSAKCA